MWNQKPCFENRSNCFLFKHHFISIQSCKLFFKIQSSILSFTRMYLNGKQERIKVYINILNVPALSGKCYLKRISYFNMFVLTNYRLSQGMGQVSSSCNSMNITPACPLPLPWKKSSRENTKFICEKRDVRYPSTFICWRYFVGFYLLLVCLYGGFVCLF